MSSKQSTGIFRLFLILSLFALVAGCGGGSSSGGGDGEDPPLSSGKAITAFSFTAEANPQLGADITGTIDEANGTILLAGPLEADAVTALKASFTTTGKEVSVGEVVQESGVTANDFAGPLTYRVTAEDGTTRDYLVHAAYWKHPSDTSEDISPDGADTYDHQVAMDGSGNAVIVWEQDGRIFKSEYRDGAWTHPEDPTNYISPPEWHAYEPQVAMDGSGNTVIVWRQCCASFDQIFMSEYRDGAWSDPASISPEGGVAEHASEPQVAMDDSGSAVIVWYQQDGSFARIFMSEYRDGAWTHPEIGAFISPAGDGNAFYPEVAMDGSGNAVIVWYQYVGGVSRIFKSEYRDGEWTDPEIGASISPAGGVAEHAEYPQVAMDGSGNAVIVWYQYVESVPRVFMSAYRDGTWTEPGIGDYISPADGHEYNNPQVAMDGSGNAVVVWTQYDNVESLYRVFKSEYRGGILSDPATISLEGDEAGNAEYPQVAMDGSGNAVVVWEQYDNVESLYRVFKSEYRGGAWTDPASISPAGDGAGDADYPQVAMDGSGNVIIVWEQEDQGVGESAKVFKSEYRFWDWEE